MMDRDRSNTMRVTSLVLLTLAAALAACQGRLEDPSRSPKPLTQLASQASHLTVTEARHVVAPGTGLTATGRLALRRFLDRVAGRNPQALHLTMSGTASEPLRTAVRREAISAGVDPTKITVVSSERAGERPGERSDPKGLAGLELIARVYAPGPPDCTNLSHVNIIDGDNTVSSNYGCVSQTNLEAMIADPRDLVRGESGGATDSELSSAAIDRLHQDKVKKLPAETAATPFTGGGAQ
jgi:pilus biogenesis lipoprotein CpaD